MLINILFKIFIQLLTKTQTTLGSILKGFGLCNKTKSEVFTNFTGRAA